MGYTAAVIGTGKASTDDETERVGMGHIHGEAYRNDNRCNLVACADLRSDRAEEFAEKFDISEQNVYTSHESLLEDLSVDIVSVCVPPAAHAEIVEAAARKGIPAIHCEKPIATTWEECIKLAKIDRESDTQITINHQRRFATPFRKAKSLLDDGEIGNLMRVEFSANNIYDYGTHSFDLCSYFADESSPVWVLGQIHYTEQNILFGEHNENQAVVTWEYKNGIKGLATTGQPVGHGVVGCHHRLIGTEGRIEIGLGYPQESDSPTLRIISKNTVSAIPVKEELYEPDHIQRSISAALNGVENQSKPSHSIKNAIRSTGLIFGAWESARRRARVEFPLEIKENPLKLMVADGTLSFES